MTHTSPLKVKAAVTVLAIDHSHNTPMGNSIWKLTTDVGNFRTDTAISAIMPSAMPLNLPLDLMLNGHGKVCDFIPTDGWPTD